MLISTIIRILYVYRNSCSPHIGLIPVRAVPENLAINRPASQAARPSQCVLFLVTSEAPLLDQCRSASENVCGGQCSS